MKPFSTLSALAVVVGGLVNVITAQVCPNPVVEPNGNIITVPPVDGQELLDIIARDCTIFEGNLTIASNFTGSFFLPNLTMITGYLKLEAFADEITSIDMPDLLSMEQLIISDPSNLASINLPKLATVGTGISITNTGMISLDYPELGGRTNVSFPQLSSLGGALELSGYFVVSLPALRNTTANINIDASSTQTVNLTSLEVANDINLEGSISGAAFPALKHVHSIDISSDVAIDCNQTQTLWNQLSEIHLTTGSFTCKTSYTSYRPVSSYTPTDHGVPVGTVLGAVLGAAGALIVVCVFVTRVQNKRHKREKVPVQETNLDEYRWRDGEDKNEELERVRTPPPVYTRK